MPQSATSAQVRYLRNHQNADGGFGLHIEGHSTMFGTALRCAAPLLLVRSKLPCFLTLLPESKPNQTGLSSRPFLSTSSQR